MLVTLARLIPLYGSSGSLAILWILCFTPKPCKRIRNVNRWRPNDTRIRKTFECFACSNVCQFVWLFVCPSISIWLDSRVESRVRFNCQTSRRSRRAKSELPGWFLLSPVLRYWSFLANPLERNFIPRSCGTIPMVDSWMGVFACPTNATRAIGFSNAIAVDSLVKLCDSAQ